MRTLTPARELNRIFSEDIKLYSSLYCLEQEKTEAVTSRDGRELERLSIEQERILEMISRLEIERSELVERHFTMFPCGEDVVFSDILARTTGEDAEALHETGRRLKRLLVKLERLKNANSKLLSDNLEYFNIMIDGLKNSTSIQSGYDSKGKENSAVSGSILFNQTA